MQEEKLRPRQLFIDRPGAAVAPFTRLSGADMAFGVLPSFPVGRRAAGPMDVAVRRPTP